MNEVTIPDIGDAEDVEVIEICVAAGDAVAENDALIVIESDKASMEVPAPFAGTVAEILVALGDQVNAGDAILRVDANGPADAAEESAAGKPVAAPPPAAPPVAPQAVAEPVAADATPAPAPAPSPPDRPSASVYAGPAVRRLARELGVDLLAVTGSGVAGRIVKEDVKAFVKRTLAAPASPLPAADIDFSRFGDIETVPLSRIRARGAANLQRSWQQVVHVTQHEDVDVTDLEQFRASLRDEAAAHAVKLTPLPFIVKACVHAQRAPPEFNAS